ncbi:MAG TPA: PspC domain-containing protein, partial [Candidatus Limnocylindria bacterium]|nr:PspC domain-containing protein [Candidatus Limnocylindria bacterium]
MNDTMNATDPGGALPPPYLPPTEPRPPLRRSRDDRVVAGVAGGLGRTFGVDPVIFRVVLVALAVIGGSGLVLYGLLWLLVPEDGSDGSSVADRWVRSRAWSTATVVLLALAAAVILSII